MTREANRLTIDSPYSAPMVPISVVADVFQPVGACNLSRLISVAASAKGFAFVWTLAIVCRAGLSLATETAQTWVSSWLVYGFFGLFTARPLFRRWQNEGPILRRWQNEGPLVGKLVVVGAGERGRRFVEHLEESGDSSVRLIGLFDDRRDRVPDQIGGYPVMGTIDDLLRFARDNPVDMVVIALPWEAEDRVLTWMKKLRSLPVDVRLCPDAIGFRLLHRGVTHVGGVPLLNVFERPLSRSGHFVKAMEDYLLAALILLLFAPLMLLIALLIKLDSPGPALFRQKRCGFNDQVIEVLKFRTMYAAPARTGEPEFRQATRGDPRVTHVGRWLRQTSLDELPQLLNVLRGEMSIIGPRPHPLPLNERYAPLIDAYLARHRVKPGITGWAQVNGLRGETETLDKMERRVQHDLYYIENWSVLFDLRIILSTLLVGFTHANAY